MEKRIVRLTESDLNKIIKESVERVIAENEMEEGWLSDKWNQAKAAGNTMFQKGDMGIKDRLKNAGKNWTSQGELNGINELETLLRQFIQERTITNDMTVRDVLRRIGSMKGNRTSQISKRGGSSY
jgi:hypothetical protein